MKREFGLVWLVVLVLGLTLCGCSDDDNPVASSGLGTDPDLIAGTWDLTGMTSSAGGTTFVVPDQDIEADPLEYTFLASGTGTMLYGGALSAFTWSVDGSILMAFGTGFSNTYEFGVSSDKLTLEFDVTEGNRTFHIKHIFTRR